VSLFKNLDQLPTRGAVIYAISPKPKDAPGFPVRAFAINVTVDVAGFLLILGKLWL
jgi:kynurenine formamidase